MASKILAQLIIMGSGILARAFVQAYRQALANAARSGITQETLQNAARSVRKVMTEQEARQILSKYDVLFENNAKKGSFYLQSKVYRAKECLERVYGVKGEGNPPS
ncbi:mitochondrial import inner membrane translocase subunit PAM16 like 2-like isoform X4 [Durio zibethinus]|uniref:Mitochondrial import inner membrane translocase subunit PAM16 like 2-like isoform X4 n=1 Tax=Durio zibethinus TaxID=66656 RepID=A0A6P5Y1H2_DURZI|nr:mitochondrial import inner membrane translocase subunit PAM16 like 2-like isoform X4 [Durio zibethinus]